MAKKAKKEAKVAKSQLNVNLPAIVCQTLGAIFLIMSVFIPSWLANPSGLNYYPYPRSWGLWYVVGRTSQSVYSAWETQCKIASLHAVDVSCLTTLCRWYESKCSAYRLQSMVSSMVGLISLFMIPVMISSTIFSLRASSKTQRWATSLAVISAAIPSILLVIYFNVMSTSFDLINSTGYYPVPQPSIGVFIYGLAIFFFVCGAMSHYFRQRKVTKELNFEEDTFYDAVTIRQQYGL